MKAMVLCAGLGTRLRPLTEHWPKPAIPLLGVPLFALTLAVLKRGGVRSVGINTHHLPDTMTKVAQAECDAAGLPLHVSHEPVLQGTGGGIRGLKSFLSDGVFVVANGDVLYPLDVGAVVAAHHASGAAATMVLLPMPAGESYAAVECDAQMSVRRIAGHGPGGAALRPWHFTGVHVMTPRVFDFMAHTGTEDINREVYPRLLGAGLRIHGVIATTYWSDLGTPARYLATQTALLAGNVSLTELGDANPLARAFGGRWEGQRVEPCLAATDAHVEARAHVGPNVYLGPGVHIERGARVSDCAVLEGTRIRSDEVLQGIIAWGAHRITTRDSE